MRHKWFLCVSTIGKVGPRTCVANETVEQFLSLAAWIGVVRCSRTEDTCSTFFRAFLLPVFSCRGAATETVQQDKWKSAS